ncbi:DNase I-like protein [Wallemia mellicola]|uniref:DNase I-like protein n=1 Tax=Wallemia mellicola TaxID=1708541 RepID=A0A4V4MF23_9BASI|nr:hypothetical protein E3Q24_00597 [Wallemia mellicola]TIC30955.1 DNase I-like protein [Wallemia mellicola]TIC32918.1 DNase I-like protein [Wallemia mellicola]TIC71568.1 DNase I-like protein [Wallemia mellicola]
MKIQVSTFNLNQKSLASVKPGDISQWLLPRSDPADLPDILVVGTQESLQLHQALSNFNTTDNLRQTSSTIHRTLSKYTDSSSIDPIYSSVSQAAFSNLTLLIYARPKILSSIEGTTTSSVGFGVGNIMSNKGAVSTRLTLTNGEVYTFVNAHLAAHDEFLERRNQDYRTLVSRLSPSIYDTNHLFVFGDLNYRLKANPDQKIVDLDKLSNDDQLTQEMQKGNTMIGLQEGEFFSFLPTYKYHVGTVDGVNNKRTPSWTDRVLYASSSTASKTLFYDSFPNITISDHKPVTAIVSLDDDSKSALSIKTNVDFDPQAEYKAYLGLFADRSVGYAWASLYTLGYGDSLRGSIITLAVLFLSYYLVH